MSIRLVIFDLDGTLVDTRADITEAMNYAIRPFGLKPLGLEQAAALIGEGISRLVEKALGEEKAAHREAALGRFLEHYSAHLADGSRPYPHAAEALRELVGVKKAVLSNKREDLSKRLLAEFGLLGYFNLVAGGDTTPEKKPSPGAVRFVLDRMGVRAEEACLVGDSRYDIEAGIGAGVLTVAVTYGYGRAEELSGADHLIDGLAGLGGLFYRNGLLDRRRDIRRGLNGVFSRYIELRVLIGEDYLPAALLDFSGKGLRFRLPVPVDPGTRRKCRISVPRSMEREVLVTLGVRHCVEEGGYYVVGAEIEDVESDLWFKVVSNIVRFITEREGMMF